MIQAIRKLITVRIDPRCPLSTKQAVVCRAMNQPESRVKK